MLKQVRAGTCSAHCNYLGKGFTLGLRRCWEGESCGRSRLQGLSCHKAAGLTYCAAHSVRISSMLEVAFLVLSLGFRVCIWASTDFEVDFLTVKEGY